MPTALLLSPHLDDVAFSCGGLAARLSDAGWRVVMATVFTRSVPDPQGFALACQLDKNLPPDVDYMALRRAEDLDAARILGVEPRHLDLPEAPHRGYGSAPALFAGYVAQDAVAPAVAAVLDALLAELSPALLLAPQALGNHVDHHRVRDAVRARATPPVLWYRDTPYAIRHPAPAPDHQALDIAPVLDRKLRASCAYATQIGFQFGGAPATGEALRRFAAGEAGGRGAAERFLGAAPAPVSAWLRPAA